MTKFSFSKIIFSISLIFLTFVSNAQVVIKMTKSGGVYTVPCKVNGRPLSFIFDTGAAEVSLSLEEALKMINLGLITNEDFLGTKYYQDATGGITEGIKVNIKLLEIDKIILKNVEATVLKTLNAPLLLGQSAFSQLGKIEFDPQKETFTILNQKLINKSITYDLFRSIVFNEKGLVDNFCGFKLLQYEDCIFNQLGKPSIRKNIESDEEYVAYKLKPESNDANLIFRLAKLPESSDLKQIVAIQISGKTSPYSVRGIKLGSDANLLKEVFGTPSKTSNITNDYGAAIQLDYENYNVSFELNNNLISSINVFYGHIKKENVFENEQLANFKVLKNALSTFTTKELVNLFAPDFEISSVSGDDIHFKKGFLSDLNSNNELLNFINDSEKGLKSLLNPKIKIENTIRIQTFNDNSIGLLSVIKIKNSTSLHEIVLKQHFGRLLIWEIN